MRAGEKGLGADTDESAQGRYRLPARFSRAQESVAAEAVSHDGFSSVGACVRRSNLSTWSVGVPSDRGRFLMSKISKTLDRVLRGAADANVRFDDLRALLAHLGFSERVRGDHHIFTRDGVVEILNLQPRGSQAKPYQVKQVRGIIVSYGLAGDPEAEAADEAN